MTSTLTGAFQLRKRLTTSLPSVALAASALVGGATLLSGGQAQAFNCSFGGKGVPPLACEKDIWYPSNPDSDKQVKFLNLPSKGQGDIEFTYIDNDPTPGLSLNDKWQVDVDFNIGDTNQPLKPVDGISTFDYLIRIDKTVNPYDWFRDVELSGGIVRDAKVTKEIWSTDASGKKLSLLRTLKIDPQNSIFDTFYKFAEHYDQLYILDTADPGTVAVGGSVDSYQNTFTQVPGPLPILGAGAAFGYTRKLRRRVKAFRMG